MLRTLASLAMMLPLASACITYPAQGSNKVVMGMSGRGSKNWKEDSHGGLKYKPWNGDPHHIDPYHRAEGDSRVFSNFKVPSSGEYVVLLESVSKHQTEFNDVFGRIWEDESKAKWMSKRCMCDPGQKTALGDGGFKMYQNSGGWTRSVYTVDHNPHAITGYFQAGRTYTFEVTGRSTQFSIKKIILVKCQGAECTPLSGTVKSALADGCVPNWCM